MDDPKINFLGDLQRLELKPGDRFVLSVPHVLSPEVCARIQEGWRGFAGDKVKLLILTDGMKLGAINTGEPD